MTQQESKHFRQLLTTFHATWLGEGDINAGTNLLAAQAITLANLARAGSGIEPPGVGRMRAGGSLLATGGLTPSLINDHLVIEVSLRQNALISHLRRLISDKIADAEKQGPRMVEFPQGPKPNGAENALFQLEQQDPLVPVDVTEMWREILSAVPNPRIEDLAAHPKVMVTTKGPKDLEHQLRHLHDNRPLVVLGLNQVADAAGYANTCNSLLNGVHPVGDCGEMAAANLLVTDQNNVLPRIAFMPGEKTGWLGRMVWLVDGTAGPDAIESHPARDKIRVDDMAARFGEALIQALTLRFNNLNPSPLVHGFDLRSAQVRWVSFLKEIEPRLPGVTGAARGLLTTLAFGLIELANASHCQPLSLSPEQVEALARWIIRRMANARAAMLGTAKSQWFKHQARKIIEKLAEGAQEKRDLYRNRSINAAQCDELLLAMKTRGLVHLVGNRCERTEKAAQLLEADEVHFIEI